MLSRHHHAAEDGIEYVIADLLSSDGIEPAVEGAEVIVHCAGARKGDDEATRNLMRAASRAGTQHVVYISVIGADRVPVVSGIDRAMFGYFATKLAAEQVVAGSGVPWTTLRAAQFYDTLLTVARQMTKLPVVPVAAGVRFQPVDTGEVAGRLAELTLGPPAGLVPDMGGPRVYPMADLLRAYLRARAGTGRWLLSGSPARPPARSGPARTWLPSERWGTGPGRTSWPIRWPARLRTTW